MQTETETVPIFNKTSLNLQRAQRPDRPKMLGDAKRLVLETYRDNRWDRAAQIRFHEICGLEPKPFEELDADGVRAILDRMEMSRMILYREE